ncbi:hypothetical protein Scep_006430 [Stephania cephalantha]|uniref:Uncharacterized protein n=1 Tax=Stephania cephalantha TaxID=152367 RepID=A0AAP0K7W9_9MAGN
MKEAERSPPRQSTTRSILCIARDYKIAARNAIESSIVFIYEMILIYSESH